MRFDSVTIMHYSLQRQVSVTCSSSPQGRVVLLQEGVMA